MMIDRIDHSSKRHNDFSGQIRSSVKASDSNTSLSGCIASQIHFDICYRFSIEHFHNSRGISPFQTVVRAHDLPTFSLLHILFLSLCLPTPFRPLLLSCQFYLQLLIFAPSLITSWSRLYYLFWELFSPALMISFSLVSISYRHLILDTT